MLNIQQIFREALQGNLNIVRVSWLASVEYPKGKNKKQKLSHQVVELWQNNPI